MTTTLAGAYCGHLLSSGGIDVVRAEPPGGHPLRAWSASGATIPDGRSGPLFSWLAGGQRSVTVDPATPSDVEALLAWAATMDAVLWSRGAPVSRRAAGGGRPRRDGHGDHAVRPDRAVGRPGGHRVHAAVAVGRARSARVAGVAADVGRRPARRVHGRRVRRRGDDDRPAAGGRHRRGRGHRPVRPRGRDDDPAVQPAHDGDPGRRRAGQAGQGDGRRRRGVQGRLRRVRRRQPAPALVGLLRHDRPAAVGRRPRPRLRGRPHRAL